LTEGITIVSTFANARCYIHHMCNTDSILRISKCSKTFNKIKQWFGPIKGLNIIDVKIKTLIN